MHIRESRSDRITKAVCYVFVGLFALACLLPLLLLVLLPRLVLFFGFLWPLCGFSLIALYDLKVIEKIFAILESGTQEPAGQN